jgi:predicted PurR-regulated permease PerM
MDPSERHFARRTALAVGIGVIVGALVLVALLAVQIFLVLFAALLIAIVLRGTAEWISRRTRLGAGVALTVVVLTLVAAIGFAGWLLLPSAAEELRRLLEELPPLVERFERAVQSWGGGQVGRVTPSASTLLDPALGAAGSSLEAVTYLVVTIVLGLYLAASPRLYFEGLVRLFPVSRRSEARRMLLDVGRTLRTFLLARLVSMAAVGLLTGFGLWVIGVPAPALLGLIAGLLTFVPYAGPVAAAVPIAAMAIALGPARLALALGYYTAVQSVEGFAITPLVQQRAVALPPVLTLIAEVLMGLLFGVVGIILAVPAAAAARVIVLRVYVEGLLERGAQPPPGPGGTEATASKSSQEASGSGQRAA